MLKYLFIILAINFAQLDRSFNRTGDYAADRDGLIRLLPEAAPGAEKAGILWRISRDWLLVGQEEPDRDAKRACFAEGVRYAEMAIHENPNDPQGYLWHCANLGRDAQTRNAMSQAKIVSKLTADLTTILDRLGRTDCSEAWQALSEIWWSHPFKSSDAAVNFARKSALTIPRDELRITTLTHLADILYQRNWSAEKRAAAALESGRKMASSGKSNIEWFSHFDGAPAENLAAPWTDARIGELSDRDEAKAIAAYAQRIFRDCPDPSPIDKNDIKILINLQKKWQ